MAVRRVSATLARTQELPYTTFLNSTIELIKNPDALAVYTYLQTKAEHWVVRREDVMNRFSIGKHRYTEAMSHLRQLGLVERAVTRDAAGKVTDNQLIIHYAPNDLSSGLRMSGNPDELDSGELGHLETDQSFKNESIDSNNSSGTSADAPCSECVGLGYHGLPDDKCHHCNGTGKEPHPEAGISGRSSSALDTDQPSKPKQAPAKPKKRSYTDDDMKFCEWMFKGIKRINPNHKEPNWSQWAKTCRLMREADKRELSEMTKVYQWVNHDSFWSTNILSMDKFRKQYDALLIKMNAANRPNMSYTGNQQSPYDDSSDFRDIMGDML